MDGCCPRSLHRRLVHSHLPPPPATNPNSTQVWDYIDGSCIQTLQGGHTREVTCLCPLPSYDNMMSTRLISGSADASVKIWDVELGRCIQVRA
jgi:WD40 repeat protein